jgi:two-component system chemotaxis response regulator CheB
MGEAIEKSIALLEKRKSADIPPEIVKEAEIAERVNVGIEQVEDLGELGQISCPDCGGSLWEINDNGFTRYRCHVGHAFTQEGLVSSMEVSAESTLWIALRMLEERKNLLKKLGEKESQRGKRNLAATYLDRSRELEAHAQKLKEILFAVGRAPR